MGDDAAGDGSLRKLNEVGGGESGEALVGNNSSIFGSQIFKYGPGGNEQEGRAIHNSNVPFMEVENG